MNRLAIYPNDQHKAQLLFGTQTVLHKGLTICALKQYNRDEGFARKRA